MSTMTCNLTNTSLAPPMAARRAGGCAHSFDVGGYKFDAGPSFHLGLSDPPGQGSNPLKQVLDLLDERLECAQYDKVRVDCG